MAKKLIYGRDATEIEPEEKGEFVMVTNKEGKAESVVAADVVRVWEE
jgi:hypothetical protein